MRSSLCDRQLFLVIRAPSTLALRVGYACIDLGHSGPGRRVAAREVQRATPWALWTVRPALRCDPVPRQFLVVENGRDLREPESLAVGLAWSLVTHCDFEVTQLTGRVKLSAETRTCHAQRETICNGAFVFGVIERVAIVSAFSPSRSNPRKGWWPLYLSCGSFAITRRNQCQQFPNARRERNPILTRRNSGRHWIESTHWMSGWAIPQATSSPDVTLQHNPQGFLPVF